jgi:hypothetical protein
MHFLILFVALFVDAPSATITGKLAMVDKAPVLRVDGKEIRLVSDDEYAPLILRDERLLSRTVHLEGQWKEQGRVFEVTHIHTVKEGKEFRVAYYCPICNIWAFKPGPCVCCLQPVELRELGDGEEAQ